jgi:hypothetical protein
MDNRKPMGDHEKKPREQRVLEHAAETENGGMPPREGREATPGRGQGGEPPRPVTPPAEPGVPNRSHR